MTRSRRDRAVAELYALALNLGLARRRVRSGMQRALDSVLGVCCLFAVFETVLILQLEDLLELLT